MADNYALPGEERLINLINEANPGANVRLGQFTFSAPSVSSVFNRNAIITATAKPGSGLTGQRVFHYNRLDIGQYFTTAGLTPFVAKNAPQNTFDILNAILLQKGIALAQKDVIQEPITQNTITLKISPNSVAWTGEVSLTIVPEQLALEDIIVNTLLSGFVYPGEMPSYAVATLTDESVTQILDLINENNFTSLTLDDVEFSALTAVASDASGRNTLLTVSAKSTGPYTGSVVVRYTRLDIGVTDPIPYELTTPRQDLVTYLDVLEALRVEHGVQIRDDEVIDNSVTLSDMSVNLVISDTSEVWLPGTVLTVNLPKIPLDMIIREQYTHFIETWLLPVKDRVSPPLSSLTQFNAILNLENNTNLTETDYTITNIMPTGFGDGSQTHATLVAAENSDYTGQVTIQYRRVDIATLVNSAFSLYPDGINLDNPPDIVDTTHDILPAILAEYNVNLSEQDIVLEPAGDQEGIVAITVANDSLVWLPNSQLNVILNALVGVHLLDNGGYHVLDGGQYHLLDTVSGNTSGLDGGGPHLLDSGVPHALDNP